jgi:hypothetical protein
MALIDNLVNTNAINPLRKIGSSATDSLSGLSRGASSSSAGAARGEYGFDKYDIASLTYPADLLGNDQSLSSKNYAIFYINVSVDSRVVKGENAQQVVKGVTRDFRSDISGQKITAKQAQLAAGLTSGPTGFIATTILSATTNAGDEAAGEEKPAIFSRPQKRLKRAIALYIPNRLEVNYGVSYSESEGTAEFQAYAKGAQEIGNVLEKKDKSSVKQAGGVAGDVLASLALAKAPGAVGIGLGLAVNPKKEQAFTGVNFRTFTFNYTFAPRSEAEAKIVRAIIYEFKYHMHPEFLSSSAFTYVYPSEFDIVYYNGPNENTNLHRHTSCVLESMSVDYTPNTLFSTFDNGMPTQINLTLTFKELLAASKETIEKGL